VAVAEPGEDYDDLIAIVETAHGVRLTPAQIDQLLARLDDEELFAPRYASLAEAIQAAVNGEGISVRAHALAVAAELEG